MRLCTHAIVAAEALGEGTRNARVLRRHRSKTEYCCRVEYRNELTQVGLMTKREPGDLRVRFFLGLSLPLPPTLRNEIQTAKQLPLTASKYQNMRTHKSFKGKILGKRIRRKNPLEEHVPLHLKKSCTPFAFILDFEPLSQDLIEGR